MSEEAKVKSFRVTDSVAEDIKRIAAEIGGNQQTAFVQMINAYELQKSMTVPALSSKTESIEKHQRLVAAISRMYLDLLEECQDQEAAVGASYEAMLKSKDNRILELEEKAKESAAASSEAINQMKEIQTQADEQSKASEKTIRELQTKLDQTMKQYENETQAHEKQLKDKELLCTTLSETCESLKKKNQDLEEAISGYEQLKQQAASLSAACDAKDLELQSLQRQMEAFEQERASIRAAAEKDLESQLARQKMDLELAKARELLTLEQKLREDQRVTVDEYQRKYSELMERYLALADTSRQSSPESSK